MGETLSATVTVTGDLVPRRYSGGTFWRIQTDQGEFVLFENKDAPIMRATGVYEVTYAPDKMGRNKGSIQSVKVVAEPEASAAPTPMSAPDTARPAQTGKDASIARMSCLKTATDIMVQYKELFGSPSAMIASTVKAAAILYDYVEGTKTCADVARDLGDALPHQAAAVMAPQPRVSRPPVQHKQIPTAKPEAARPEQPAAPTPAPKAPAEPERAAEEAAQEETVGAEPSAADAGIPAAFAPHPEPKKTRTEPESGSTESAAAVLDKARRLSHASPFAERMRSRLQQMKQSAEQQSGVTAKTTS